MARATKRLSARAVDTTTKPGLHADGDGLYLRVDASGFRRWVFIYFWHGKRREMGLGRMGLKEAREARDEIRRQIRSRVDPITARRNARDTEAAIPTFDVMAAKVITEAKERSTNEKVRYQWELLLGSQYWGSILKKRITEITSLDIEQVLRPVWRRKPETGRKLLVRLHRVFKYAKVYLRDQHGITMPTNPAEWEDLQASGFERISKLSRGHHPALEYQQAQGFLAELHKRGGFAARAVEVTLLTALRTGEVIGAKRHEIDLEKKIWTIPITRMKDRKTRKEPHRVPLSPQVVEIFKTIFEVLPAGSEFVFPGGRRGKPLSNMAMRELLKKMNNEKSGDYIWVDPDSKRPIVPHGLRATFKTWGEETGQRRELIEQCIAHKVGNLVEQAYRRTDNLEQRQPIMNAWADYCFGVPIGRMTSVEEDAPHRQSGVRPIVLTDTDA